MVYRSLIEIQKVDVKGANEPRGGWEWLERLNIISPLWMAKTSVVGGSSFEQPLATFRLKNYMKSVREYHFFIYKILRYADFLTLVFFDV